MKKSLRYNKPALKIKKEPVKNELNVKAITNDIKVNKGNFITTNDQIIYYGNDNRYPDSTYEAIRLSPTAKGCMRNTTNFIYGQGIDGQYKKENKDIVVNRWGESLSEVVKKAIETYSWIDGFALHFNFNLMGEITEITNVDLRLIRKTKDFKKAVLNDWGQHGAGYYSAERTEVFIYDYMRLKEQITEDGGFEKFKGNIYYWTVNNGIYPLSKADASSPSAQLENEIQIYNYASIKNSFNSSGLIKIPGEPNTDEDGNQIPDYVDTEIAKMKGAENAGSFLKLYIPTDIENKLQNINLFEPFQQNNVDKMYVEQTKNARNNILTEYLMPGILLARQEDGMFNMEQYEQAFDYYNALTQPERNLIEKAINRFWGNTIFASELNEIKIIPLEMKGAYKDADNDSNQSTGNKNGSTV